MTAINRNATQPGPITELYDRLDELHLKAGLPSMREIAARAGRGRISSSTMHNVFAFRNARVPRWPFLEEIRQGAGRRRRGVPSAVAGGLAGGKQHRDIEGQRTRGRRGQPRRGRAGAPRAVRLLPGDLVRRGSLRNLNFTGRATELENLRANLLFHGRPVPPAQVISGMGGVGKTEIATEYIHVHRDKYRTSSGGSGPSITTGSGTRWSGWASGWNCGWSRRWPGPGHRDGAGSPGVGLPAELAAGLRQRGGAA